MIPERTCEKAVPLIWADDRKKTGLRLENSDHETTFRRSAHDLLLNRQALSERSSNELTDCAVPCFETIQPRLQRAHEVVLRIPSQERRIRLTGDGIDYTRGDLNRVRLPLGSLE